MHCAHTIPSVFRICSRILLFFVLIQVVCSLCACLQCRNEVLDAIDSPETKQWNACNVESVAPLMQSPAEMCKAVKYPTAAFCGCAGACAG